MTELLRRAITEIKKLPDTIQDEIATRLLNELKENQELKPRIPGIDKGRLVVPDDFDEPLPQEIMKAFENKISN
jgi:hypothetical protein